MCRFIESICAEHGYYSLLSYHQQRVNEAFKHHFPNKAPHTLQDLLPTLTDHEKYKIRIVYDETKADVEVVKYDSRDIRSLALVEDSNIEYAFKYEDRSNLEVLFDQRGEADEILILKDGLVTDAFYANVAFYDGQNWFVPDTYLLNGVQRQYLIDKGRVQTISIAREDIKKFEKVSLINAMNKLGEIEVSAEDLI